MKSILLSIKPKWIAKILNGEKTIEIRKMFPKDYVGWVYIYCTKEDDLGCIKKIAKDKYVCGKDFDINEYNYLASGYNGKGKVVARFWCDKVESIGIIKNKSNHYMVMNLAGYEMKETCLTDEQLYNYLKGKDGFAIHISKLEIFDRPRELREFRTWCKDKPMKCEKCKQGITKVCSYRLTKAPQNYCYVEGE